MSEWQDTLGPWRAGNVKYKKDGRDFLVFERREIDVYKTVADLRRDLLTAEAELGPDALVGAEEYSVTVTGARRPTIGEREKIAKHVERLKKQRVDLAARKKDRDVKVLERLRRDYPEQFAG